MKKFVILFLTIGLMVSPMLFGGVGTAQAAKPIKIGTILNLTGPIAFIGPLFKNGIVMALEEVNYTVGGRKIELIPEDAAADMNVCLEKAKKLVERDQVHIIIGPLMGDAHMAIAPYLANKKVLTSSFYCGDLELTKYKNWFIYPTTLVGLTAPVGYYAAELGHKTMITAGTDYAGGHGFIKGIKMAFEEKGGKVVQEVWWPVGNKDFGPYLSSLKKADTIGYFVEGPSAAQLFLSQYHEFGVKTPMLGTTLAADMPQQITSQLGDWVLGLKGQALYMADMDTAINKAWVKKMTKRFGQAPGGLEANSYAITKTILAALKATGGDDSLEKMWPALLKVKIDTPQGPLAVSPEGVALVNNYIVELKKRGNQYYWDPIKTYKAVEDPRLKK
ncbi:MAG: ABC transporter substrate-binding protein [Desulfobacteraceae bacterium]|nr:ABC transporter substrate-binding protein [Desulfobacteraceae bacterium]